MSQEIFDILKKMGDNLKVARHSVELVLELKGKLQDLTSLDLSQRDLNSNEYL